jgi:hypothetical protein
MVAGVLKLYLRLNKLDDALEYWRAAMERAKIEDAVLFEKLHGDMLLIDRKTGHGYLIGLWETAEDSRTFEESIFYQERIAEIEIFCLRPPVQERFEIAGGNLDLVLLNKLAA